MPSLPAHKVAQSQRASAQAAAGALLQKISDVYNCRTQKRRHQSTEKKKKKKKKVSPLYEEVACLGVRTFTLLTSLSKFGRIFRTKSLTVFAGGPMQEVQQDLVESFSLCFPPFQNRQV